MSDTPATGAPAAADSSQGDAPDAPEGGEAGAQPPKGMTAAQKKIWKLKADGEEFEFDASDEEAVKREVMKARGANKRFEEGAKLRKQAEQFFGMLKDPKKLREVLADPRVGIDVKKWAEEQVWEDLQERSLTPEQKRQRDIERELQKYKEREETEKKTVAEREAQELHQRFSTDYEKKIVGALETGGLPKTPATVKRMAHYMLQSVQNGYDLEPHELVERVRQDYMEEVQALFGQTDGDQLLALLGEGVGKKIRESDLKRLKTTQGNQFQTPKPRDTPAKGQPKSKKLSGNDWLASVRRGSSGK